MKIIDTEIAEVKILEPIVFADNRGYFFESFRNNEFCEQVCKTKFVQENESASSKGVLRGLHYQCGEHSQSKLVRVVVGEVFDVAVDIRKGSPTFGKYVGVILSAENKRQFFIPRGFAHGFMVLSDTAVFTYKCDNYYNKASERSIIYNDPTLNIEWPKCDNVILSEKDMVGKQLADADLFNYSDKLYE